MGNNTVEQLWTGQGQSTLGGQRRGTQSGLYVMGVSQLLKEVAENDWRRKCVELWCWEVVWWSHIFTKSSWINLGQFTLAEEWRKDHKGVRQETGRKWNGRGWNRSEQIQQYLRGRNIRISWWNQQGRRSMTSRFGTWPTCGWWSCPLS